MENVNFQVFMLTFDVFWIKYTYRMNNLFDFSIPNGQDWRKS